MPDLVVQPKWNHAPMLELRGINHGADFDDRDNMIYVHCFGPTDIHQWVKSEEGAPITCFRCLVYGPREEFHRRNPYGQRGREECVDGARYLVFDTETSGRGY